MDIGANELLIVLAIALPLVGARIAEACAIDGLGLA
jgi:hypothetical protein